MSAQTITYSAELMQNYLQAEIMQPEAGFQAIQTKGGNALLLSLGTDNSLYVTAESPGLRTGWARSNLSAAQAAASFGGESGAVCKDFTVAQQPDGSIHLAMVLAVAEQNDRLFLSLGNSDADTSWIDSPNWREYPYDDPDHPRSKVQITDVFISEASDGEYIVVDVIRDPDSAEKLIFRYYIDTSRENGYAWRAHDVAVDIEAGRYRSCLGRKSRQGSYAVDGIYTSGQVNGRAQLIYAPLFNVFDPSLPPNPDRLRLPDDGLVPDALAACRQAADNTSALYVAAGDGLYYFASDNQEDGATAELLTRNALFTGVRSLFAFETGDGSVMVWGLNADDQIFYTTCPSDQLTTPAAWSYPVPIMGGVEQVSPYVNRAYSANSFFAHAGENRLIKAVKSPDSTLWNRREIALPPPTTTTAALRFNSYTTHIQVLDANNQPVGNAPVSLSASNVITVYINHLYYVLSPAPIHVNTDALGALTIVEGVHTLAGSVLTVSSGEAQVTINPMDAAFQKAASLDSPDALRGATVPGTGKPLMPDSTHDEDLHRAAQGIGMLAQAYATLDASASHAAAAALTFPGKLVDAGDLFSWLGETIETEFGEVTHSLELMADGVWHFVTAIAGEVYRAALDTVEKVVSAAQWLFNVIKVAIEDLIDYLKYLFDFDDMQRSQRVIKNIIKVYLNHQADQIEVFKGELDRNIESLRETIREWAGLDWSQLGDEANAPAGSKSTQPAPSAPGSLLSHHFQGNVHSASTAASAAATPTPPDANPINVLIQAAEREADIIGDTFDQLHDLATEFATLPLDQVLKKLVAILADAVLGSAETIMDALLDVLYDLAKAAIDGLDTPIHIPVISDILSGFGVPEFSMLDIACWVVAVPATIIYKLTLDEAPFPDNEETDFFIHVQDYQALVDRLRQPSAAGMPTRSGGLSIDLGLGDSSALATRSADFSLDLGSGDSGAPPTRSAGFSIDLLAGDSAPVEPPAPVEPASMTYATRSAASPSDKDEPKMPGTGARVVFIILQMASSFATFAAAGLYFFEAQTPEVAAKSGSAPGVRQGAPVAAGAKAAPAPMSTPLKTAAVLFSLTASITKDVGNNWVASYASVQSKGFNIFSYVVMGITLLAKIGFEAPGLANATGPAKTIGKLQVTGFRSIGAIVDAVLVIPSLVISIYHVVEVLVDTIGGDPHQAEGDNVAFGKVLAIATLDELANLSSYVSRVSYAVAVNCGQEPEVMEPAAAIMAATMVIGGGLQFAEAVVAITV